MASLLPPPDEPAPPVCLPDVLDMLPLDVIRDNIWGQLIGPHEDVCHDPNSVGNDSRSDAADRPYQADCSTFKLLCKQTAQLVDELITSAAYDVGRPGVDCDEASPERDGEPLPSWLSAQQLRTAFLSRLPRLTSLRIKNWTSEEDLIQELEVCVTTTQGRVSHLALSGKPTVRSEAMSAVRQACPSLRQLLLRQCGDYTAHMSAGPLFEELHNVGLNKVVVISYDPHYDKYLISSLGSLPTLRHLSLYLSAHAPKDLCGLSALTALTFASVNLRQPLHFNLLDIAPLFKSTGLTSLQLSGLKYDGPGPHLPRKHAAALTRLGALSRLSSLDLGADFKVNDAAFAVLRRLTLLTQLHVREIALAADPIVATAAAGGAAAPGGGHLPHLRRLGLCAGMMLRPADLLQSLKPLLPLRSLTQLNCGYLWSRTDACGLNLHLGHEGGDDAGVEAAALRCVAQALAAAPLLRWGEEDGGAVNYGNCCDEELTGEQLEDGLRPLAERFPRLAFVRVHLQCGNHAMAAKAGPGVEEEGSSEEWEEEGV